MVEKWETIDDTFIANHRIFNVHKVRRRHRVWNKESDFVVLDSPPWVNIIPVTPDNRIVLIEQYRHGIDDITLEIPGGLVETGEVPRVAGERECLEETGYSGNGEALLLGENQPNPAFLNNICYSYIWFGCKKIKDQKLDGNEDINTIEIPAEVLKNYILSGKIRHSLVLTAFYFYSLKYGL